MIKFVVSKPIRKIQRTPYHGESERRFNNQKKKRIPLKTIWIVFGIFVLIYGGFLLFKNTLFAQENIITKVQYATGDVQIYDDPYMYKLISAYIKKENYNIVRLNKGSIVQSIQTKYPFIKDMTITLINANTVKVDISFAKIDLVIRNQQYKFGLYQSTIFPLYSGNTLGRGIKILDLPAYLSGQTAMTGLFFRQSASGLVQQVELMYQGFPGLHHIEYLPGGERSIVFINGKEVYINNLADIAQQIRNYELLKKYYTNFNQLTQIDLGSIELDKVIVKK